MLKMLKKIAYLLLLPAITLNPAFVSGQTINAGQLKVMHPPDTGHICSLSPTDVNAHLSIMPGRDLLKKMKQSPGSFFEVDYRIETGNSCGRLVWPQVATDAFEYTLNLWSAHLTSDVPIKIMAVWRNIESTHGTVLASAGPTRIAQLHGTGMPDTWYSLAQITAMSGMAVRDQIENVDHDLTVNINCSFNEWYFGTDANTPQNQIDFVTVVFHEIMHGVVYFGSMTGDNNTKTGKWGLPEDKPMPFIFDKFAVNRDGTSLLDPDAYPNPSAGLYDALTGRDGGIFFDGEHANNTLNGENNSPAMLYTPREFMPGSSFSHVDQFTYTGTADALMRPFMDRALAIHTPGPLLCGMLSDMEWPLDVGCLRFLAADALIAISETALDFGVSNIGKITQKTFMVSNDVTSGETLSGSVETDKEYFAVAGKGSFQLNPGESAEFTVQYYTEVENRHTGMLSVFHNAKNVQSPVMLPLTGETLKEDQIVKLEQSYPNPVVPSNPPPLIPFAIAADADVSLDLYSITGRHLQSLVNTRLKAGRYKMVVNMQGLSSGIYIYRIVVDKTTESKKLILIK